MQFWGLSLSIGILAGIWTYASATFGLLTWPAFVGWAIFFFAGGDKAAIMKGLPPIISGVVCGYVCVLVFGAMAGGTVTLAVLVAIIAFIMTFMMNMSLFALAPAAFASCASFFGAGDPVKALAPLVIGLLLGYVSVLLPAAFTSGSGKDKSA